MSRQCSCRRVVPVLLRASVSNEISIVPGAVGLWRRKGPHGWEAAELRLCSLA